jgi:glucose-1-phosphate cytidylyltransferase
VRWSAGSSAVIPQDARQAPSRIRPVDDGGASARVNEAGEPKPKVVILCGGLGTRLREETEYRPKPMVEIGGKPILWHIMKVFAHHGFTDFVLCVGYRGQIIKDWFLNYDTSNSDFTITLGHPPQLEVHNPHAEQGWTVTVCDTGATTMTGGRVKQIARHVGPGPFFVTYGDGLADIDISALLATHRAHGRTATVTATRPLSRFGHVDLDAGQVVRTFREKPQTDDWVNSGFFVFEQAMFDYLDDNSILEQEPLEQLAKDGEIVAYRHDGFWRPMDTYRDTLLLNEVWASGKAPWKVWDR